MVWHLSNWIGMALPLLEHDFRPLFDAYRVQTFDLILVCAMPFTEILIIHGTGRVVVHCQSDVPSILAEVVKTLHCRNWKKKKRFFFSWWKSWAMSPAIWAREEQTQHGIWGENKSALLWQEVCCHLLLGPQSCTHNDLRHLLDRLWLHS